MGIDSGTGVCWEYMFIGTGMKTGTGTGTINTFTFSPPAEEDEREIKKELILFLCDLKKRKIKGETQEWVTVTSRAN